MKYSIMLLIFSFFSQGALAMNDTHKLLTASRIVSEIKSQGYSDICSRNPNRTFNPVANMVRREINFKTTPMTTHGKGTFLNPFIFCIRFIATK